MAGRADKYGDLVVPFIFVPRGTEPPAEWLAENPGAVHFPATLKPRGSGARKAGRRALSGVANAAPAAGETVPGDD